MAWHGRIDGIESADVIWRRDGRFKAGGLNGMAVGVPCGWYNRLILPSRHLLGHILSSTLLSTGL